MIEDAKFKTYGCGSAIASSSLVTEWVKGKTLDEALAIKNTQIAEELALPPVKIHCSILPKTPSRRQCPTTRPNTATDPEPLCPAPGLTGGEHDGHYPDRTRRRTCARL